jgi:hypothetical protein
MGKVEELLRREFFKSTQGLPPPDESNLRALPSGWSADTPNYQVLAEQINALVGEQVPLGATPAARVIEAGGWLDRTALVRHPAAGATGLVGGMPVGFPMLALGVHELTPESGFGVQKGLTFGPIEIRDFKLFYFRVLDARPESPPDSLEEVATQAREDLLRLRAYERLLSERDAIRDQIVQAGGYLELYDRYKLGLTPRQGMTITRDTVTPAPGASPVPALNNPALRDAVVDAIEAWNPLQAASQVPYADRVLSVPLPRDLSVAFVVITGFRPVTEEALRQNDSRVLQAARNAWSDTPYADPFSFEAVAARLGFKPAGSAEEPVEEEPQEASS